MKYKPKPKTKRGNPVDQGRVLVCPGCRNMRWEDAGLRKTSRALRCPECGHVERMKIPVARLPIKAFGPKQLTIDDPPVGPPKPLRKDKPEAPGVPADSGKLRTIYALMSAEAFEVWRLAFEVCLERTRNDPSADRRLAQGRAIELIAGDFLAGCADDELGRARVRIATQGTLPLEAS